LLRQNLGAIGRPGFHSHTLFTAPPLRSASRSTTKPKALPEPALLAIGAAAIAGISGIVWSMRGAGEEQEQEEQQDYSSVSPSASRPLPRENATLVLGASGRVGRRVVQRLIKGGHTVVAASTSAEATEKLLTGDGMGLQAGRQTEGDGILFFETADMRSVDSLSKPQLWKGVTQVINVVGGKAGMKPDGQFGYFDGLGPDAVEAAGMANLMSVLPQVFPKRDSTEFKTVLPMGSAEEVAVWERMDDVIMGGNSSSAMAPAPDQGPYISRWQGTLVLEGGGFCGQRTKPLVQGDWSAYDGVAMRVFGDGQIYKFNIKTVDQLDSPESTYQTTFDTTEGQWEDVFLPWHNFVPVKRAQSDPEGLPIDPSKLAKFGLVHSRFEFNKMPNPKYREGAFELLINGGIRAFKAVRPQIIQLSSACVEVNAIVGDDAEKRKLSVPIVQLNPGGLLNHKYSAECAARTSGYPYVVIRSAGMIDSTEGSPFLFDMQQGDRITGVMSRDDTADVIVAAALTPETVGKTFEVRRSEYIDGKGKAMTPANYNHAFLSLALDRHRWRVGLRPFPRYVDPPKPVDAQEKEKIVENIADIRRQRGEVVTKDDSGEREGATFIPPTAEADKEVVGAGAR